jgi:transcriptional regulator
MGVIEDLEKILKTEVLVQVNEEIETLKKFVLKQKDNEDLKIELDYMLDVKKYYDEVIIHIEKNILKEDDAVKILQDLEDMRDDEDDI